MTNKILYFSFFLNLILSIVKFLGGLIGNSSSMIASSIQTFSDSITDIVAIIGEKFSKKNSSKDYPYGFGRLEYITSLIIGIVILFAGFEIFMDLVFKENKKPEIMVVYVSLITLIIKYLFARILIKNGKKFKNNIYMASGKESMSDVYATIIVFLTSLLSQTKFYFIYIDKIAGFLIGFFILKIGISIIQDNGKILLDKQDSIFSKNIRILLNKYNINNVCLIKYGYYDKIVIDVKELLDKEEVENIKNIVMSNYSNIKIVIININT